MARRRTLRTLHIQCTHALWPATETLRMVARLELSVLGLWSVHMSHGLAEDVPACPTVRDLDINVHHVPSVDAFAGLLRRFPGLQSLTFFVDGELLPATVLRELVDRGALQVERLNASVGRDGEQGDWCMHPPTTPGRLSGVRFLTLVGDRGRWWSYRCEGVRALTIVDADVAAHTDVNLASYPALRELAWEPHPDDAEAARAALQVRLRSRTVSDGVQPVCEARGIRLQMISEPDPCVAQFVARKLTPQVRRSSRLAGHTWRG